MKNLPCMKIYNHRCWTFKNSFLKVSSVLHIKGLKLCCCWHTMWHLWIWFYRWYCVLGTYCCVSVLGSKMSAKSDNLTSQNLTRHIFYINLKKIIQYKVKANLRLYHSPFTQLVIQIQFLLFLRKGSLFIFLLGIEGPLKRYLHLTSMSPRFVIFCWDSPKFSNFIGGTH